MTRPASAGPPAPQPPTDGTPGDLVRWEFDIINTHTSAPLRVLWDEETIARFPTGSYRGADEIVGWFDTLFTALPDLTMTMESMAEQDTTVFVRWRMTGTHTGGTLEGIEPTGRRLDLDGIDNFVFRPGSGVVASNTVVFDQMTFARQLGLLPADGSRVDVGLKLAFNTLTRWRG